MNTDASEDYFFIVNNDEEVEETVAEADNEEKADVKIVNEKFNEPINDISTVAFTESDDEEEKI